MLITHLKDKFPTYATESPPVGDLQAFYKVRNSSLSFFGTFIVISFNIMHTPLLLMYVVYMTTGTCT